MTEAVLEGLRIYVNILIFCVGAVALVFALMGALQAAGGILWLHGMVLWHGPKWLWKKAMSKRVEQSEDLFSKKQRDTFNEWMEKQGDTVIDE